MSTLIALSGLALAAACTRAEQAREAKPVATQAAPIPAPASPAAPSMPADSTPTVRGKVLETFNTAGYTYVRVQPADGKEIWGATTEFSVKVGDEVIVPTVTPMENYESATLHRKFDVVYFADAIGVVGQDTPAMREAALASAHAGVAKPAPASVDLHGIEKAKDGLTVAEVVAQGDALAGKSVTFRGRVVKFTPAVMGKNWLHVRDGSGDGGAADITVTTQDAAAIGDLVLVKGNVATKQDFGSGYSYAVLIQDAKLEAQN